MAHRGRSNTLCAVFARAQARDNGQNLLVKPTRYRGGKVTFLVRRHFHKSVEDSASEAVGAAMLS